MGIYYVGVTSCILERFPRFIQDARQIYGASAGALMAAALSAGVPLGELWPPGSHLVAESALPSFSFFGQNTWSADMLLSGLKGVSCWFLIIEPHFYLTTVDLCREMLC